MEARSLNRAQIEVLNALATLKTEKDVLQLKAAIAEFFAKRADVALDKLFDDGEWTDQTRLMGQNGGSKRSKTIICRFMGQNGG